MTKSAINALGSEEWLLVGVWLAVHLVLVTVRQMYSVHLRRAAAELGGLSHSDYKTRSAEFPRFAPASE
jgi:hypothetical protein